MNTQPISRQQQEAPFLLSKPLINQEDTSYSDDDDMAAEWDADHSSTASQDRTVRFDCQVVVHEIPKSTDSERPHLWYTKEEESRMMMRSPNTLHDDDVLLSNLQSWSLQKWLENTVIVVVVVVHVAALRSLWQWQHS